MKKRVITGPQIKRAKELGLYNRVSYGYSPLDYLETYFDIEGVDKDDLRYIYSDDLGYIFDGDDVMESYRPNRRMIKESDDNTYDVRLHEIFRTVQDSRNQINKLYDRLDRFAIALDKSDKKEILDDLMDMEETIKGLERKLS